MRLSKLASVIAVLSISGVGAAVAADIEAGKSKAGPCAVCHGANGEGKGGNPPLAGMATARFVQAMKDYSSGKRASGVMKGYAAKLSEADTADLAAYYASLKKQ